MAELVAQFQFSNHRLFFCLFRALSVSRGGLREGQELPLSVCVGATSSLPCAYLWAAAMLTCLYIPIQLNIARFLFPALAPVVSLGASSSTVAGCERR